MMRQMDEDQKDAEQALEEGTKKAEEMQAAFNKAQRDEANKRTEGSDGADYAVEGDATKLQLRDQPGALQIETEAIEHMKNQELFAEGTHNLLSQYFSEGDQAEATIESWNQGAELAPEKKEAPQSKPVLVQKKAIAAAPAKTELDEEEMPKHEIKLAKNVNI